MQGKPSWASIEVENDPIKLNKSRMSGTWKIVLDISLLLSVENVDFHFPTCRINAAYQSPLSTVELISMRCGRKPYLTWMRISHIRAWSYVMIWTNVDKVFAETWR